MPAALSAGQVQAVTEVEPFVAAIAAHGGKLLSPLFEGEQPGMLVSGYFTNSSELATNPGIVKRFVAAINESLNYAAANPAAARGVIRTYSSIPVSVANSMKLRVWNAKIGSNTVQGQEQLSRRQRALPRLPPAPDPRSLPLASLGRHGLQRVQRRDLPRS